MIPLPLIPIQLNAKDRAVSGDLDIISSKVKGYAGLSCTMLEPRQNAANFISRVLGINLGSVTVSPSIGPATARAESLIAYLSEQVVAIHVSARGFQIKYQIHLR